MEIRRNFGMIVWAFPIYIALAFAWWEPFLLPFAIPIGLAVTVGGLVWQIVVNQYQAQGYNLVLLMLDRKPRARGMTFRDYWPWEAWVQLWIRGDPREVTDADGWTTAYLHLLNGGIVHPAYNAGQRIHWIIFRYGPKGHTSDGQPIPTTWNDLIRYAPGEGFFRGSIVDIKNVCRVWGTELVAEILPDPSGLPAKELLNLVPSLIREDEDGFQKWIPVIKIRRADGSIDIELDHEEALRRIIVRPEPGNI